MAFLMSFLGSGALFVVAPDVHPLYSASLSLRVCVCARVFVCVDVYRLRRAVADSAENFEKLKTGWIRRKKLKQKLGCMINCKLYSRLNSFIIFLILKYERIGKYLYDFYCRVYTKDLTYCTNNIQTLSV